MSFGVSLAISILLSLPLSLAQQSSQAAAPIIVPRQIQFSGAINDVPGQPHGGVLGITFALYKDQAGGAALWLETQNVSLDVQGRYTVLLGANSAEGMPVELFTANEARWLGVQPEGQAEQRVLLVSVPYALKAVDAETLGGRPASSFVLAAPVAAGGSGNSGSGNSGAGTAGGSSTSAVSPAAICATPPCTVMTSGGTANFLSLFTDATTVQDSVLSQSPCPFDASQTCVGIGTTNPARILDVNGEIRVEGGNLFLQRDKVDLLGRRNWAWGTETFNVGDVSLFVSSSNLGYASISPVFTALSNGWMGVGVATPAANLEVAGTGGGLLVDSPGVITGSGAGLTNLPAASLTGTLPAAALAGVNGSGLTNVNAAMLGGAAPGAFALLGTAGNPVTQTFSGTANLQGNLALTALNGVNPNLTVTDANGDSLSITAGVTINTSVAPALTINSAGCCPVQENIATPTGPSTGVAFGVNLPNSPNLFGTGLAISAPGTNEIGASISASQYALTVNTSGESSTTAKFANAGTGNATAPSWTIFGSFTGGPNTAAFVAKATGSAVGGFPFLAQGAGGSATFFTDASGDVFNAGTFTSPATLSNVLTSGSPLCINASALIGVCPVTVSSRRFKHAIADMGAESDLLMKLRPVAFYYKPELDETQTRQYGLVAEEVAQVAPQLVVYDKDGIPQTVRYHLVNAMLLNEVQKQQRLLEKQRETIGEQESRMQDLEARLAKLEAALAEKR
ncbi:MAG: tail fiber domain-containing protein [Terriglobales bacterium]